MDMVVTQRRHNPVDSICRKLQTIQRRDQEANSPFQIPKFQSSSYDSPQSGLRGNLEAILKKRTVARCESECASPGVPTPACPLGPRQAPRGAPSVTPANCTYTTATLGERRATGPGHGRAWQRSCSTPAAQTVDRGFSFSRFPAYPQSDGAALGGERHKSPMRGLMAYNLNFCSSDTSGLLDCELGYPALVVKRLSMGEGALFTSEPKKESMSEVSLICEEDLLDTIFHACDTQRRGKVYVSRIVDYLRHTTSRSSEDSGLEELCNMLDPERKDVSIDLDTYHAIMKEWIEDCRNQGDDTPEDLTQESVKLRDSLSAKRSALLNMTSGSLEAFGGEASRGDLETSDLVYCVADLQFNNQKLQEEARKLKQAVETMEDTNQKLIEENEDLKSKARVGQQLAQNEKLLKEEVEEMKMSLSSSEEGRARAATQSKHLARENQALIAKIASLQEENIKVTVDMDDLQKKMIELCDLNADLQVQIHSCDAVMAEKASVIRERNGQIAELRSAIEEYSSVTELLRADKTKLENQMQMMQPDVAAAAGLSLSAAYRLNQSSSGSLQTELALAQSPLEGAERAASSICFASPLDVTLDREVLLLLQGPSPEQMSLEFKSLISKLNREFKEDSLTVLSALRGLPETHNRRVTSTDQRLQGLQAELQQRRMEWARGLEQLDLYTGSLEKELLKMASNMRRSRTEILHLSVRVQEQENQKQQLREELDQLKTPQDSREASCQTPDNQLQDLDAPLLEWDEEYVLPESPPDNDGPRELRSDEELLRDFGCEEEELQGLREEEEEPLVSGRPGLGSGGGVQKQGSNGEGEGQQDSGVEEEELRGDSTLSQKTTLEQGSDREGLESSDIPEGALREMSGSLEQEEARLPGCTGPAHGQAVQREQSEPGLQPRPHTQLAEALTLDPIEAHPQNQMLSPSDTPPVLDETISLTGRSPQPAAGAGGAAEDLAATAGMTDTQKLSQDQLVDPSAALERSNLLPVAEEEEPMQEAGQVPTVEVDTTGTDAAPGLDSPRTDAPGDPSDDAKDAANLEPGSADEGLGGQPRKDPLMLRSVFKKELELSRSVEATEEHKAMGHKDACTATEKEGDGSVIAEDANDSTKEERNSLSPSDKEIETEFHRLSLGFKCDIFTLEKRLRLEERSRDLAEENVRREVSSCQGLLQALIPLCEDDNQSMEIIQRLQKNLDILIQSMTRVSSRSEMLGAIHQESRIGKAVEVMVQHVENLRRMYTKEHAELLELRETLMQNERSFGSHPHDRGDEFRNKKQTGSQYYKPKSQDSMETEVERLSRRAPWNLTGKSSQRPPLKRFVSSGAWAGAETDDPLPMNRYGNDTDSPSEEERREEPAERKSSLTELGNKITSLIMPLKTLSTSPSPSEPAVRYLTVGRPVGWSGARGLWVWVALVVVLAVLLALLASLVLQPAVDAAPVGTGDSWMTIQQLLWPYTGLRHNGQPPV